MEIPRVCEHSGKKSSMREGISSCQPRANYPVYAITKPLGALVRNSFFRAQNLEIEIFIFYFYGCLLLRLEQQALHLVDTIKSLGSKVHQMMNDEDELDTRQQVSTHHVEFLVNMSRAMRRRDWAWFEIAETELQKLYVLKSLS